MPMQRDLYPERWNQIAIDIKVAVNWRCEECGKECRRSGERLIDFCIRTASCQSQETLDRLQNPQRWTLTVAHLNHVPPDVRSENLKALCAPCHCRMDLKAMALKKQLKRERNGQLSLFAGSIEVV